MKQSLIKIYRKITPEILRDKLFSFRKQFKKNKSNLPEIQKKIVDFLDIKENITEQESEVLHFLKSNEITTFPYLDMNKSFEIEVVKDLETNLYYVLHENKKLFFKPQTTKESNREYYRGLLIEQSEKSPHRYLTETFNVNKDTIVVDVGAAEGNFSLSVIDIVKKVYIFETDPNWIIALKETFKPWKNKVEIIQGFVSDNNSNTSITLDTYFEDKKSPNFLKLDVEGFEEQVLKGAKQLLSNQGIKVAICTYHNQGDDIKYKAYFKERGFNSHFSERYMFFLEDISNFTPPYLRKGLLRAEN